jgi:hypothetical protein
VPPSGPDPWTITDVPQTAPDETAEAPELAEEEESDPT